MSKFRVTTRCAIYRGTQGRIVEAKDPDEAEVIALAQIGSSMRREGAQSLTVVKVEVIVETER